MPSAPETVSPLQPTPLRPDFDVVSAPKSFPAPLTRLIGRERELATVRALLDRPEVRLVTLTGPGGVGKTRLALALAAEEQAHFAHGAVFVPLAPVRDPALVLPTIARALDLRETAHQSVAERLRSFLATREMLLILDNVEQVLAAAPSIAGLLANCPGLTVLATSRASLHVSGERNVRIPPLSLPDPIASAGMTPPSTDLIRSDAVRLFAERAQEARADFTLTQVNAGAVTAICRRLDGLPLAIELAAARVKLFSPAALLTRLERRLPLLTGGPGDAPQRQRTMRNAIGWSYDLLAAEEQTLFRCLSVFVGGFTLDAAEYVRGKGGDASLPSVFNLVATTEDEQMALLDGVGALVGASLLGGDNGATEEPRYRMLETIREFGLEALAAAGEEQDVQDRHADHSLVLAEQAARELTGPGQSAWLDRLEAEHANLRTALDCLRAQGDAERGLRLGAALSEFWFRRSHLGEGRTQLESLIALPAAGQPTAARARALAGACQLADWQGDLAGATARGEEALAIWRSLGDARGMATALFHLCSVAIRAEDDERAETLGEESLTLFREAGDRWGEALVLGRLPIIAYARGEIATAAAGHEVALALSREVADPWLLGVVLGNLAHAYLRLGEHTRAWTAFAECIAVQQTIRDRWRLAWCVAGMAGIAAATGQPEQAARLLGAAAAIRESTGGPLRSFIQEDVDRIVADVQSALAEETFAAAWATGRALTDEQAIAAALAVTPPDSTVTVRAAAPLPTSAAHHLGLTPREVDVLRLLVDGRADRQIAEALSISPHTVMRHVQHILAKLDVESRTAAATQALRLDLI